MHVMRLVLDLSHYAYSVLDSKMTGAEIAAKCGFSEEQIYQMREEEEVHFDDYNFIDVVSLAMLCDQAKAAGTNM